MSLTWWLIAVADCSCANSKFAPEKKISANAALRDIVWWRRFSRSEIRMREPPEASRARPSLKSESRLITHGDAIEHITRRGRGSVSLGAFIKTANRLRPENLRGHRRCKAPFPFRACRHRQSRRALESDASRLRLLINL